MAQTCLRLGRHRERQPSSQVTACSLPLPMKAPDEVLSSPLKDLLEYGSSPLPIHVRVVFICRLVFIHFPCLFFTSSGVSRPFRCIISAPMYMIFNFQIALHNSLSLHRFYSSILRRVQATPTKQIDIFASAQLTKQNTNRQEPLNSKVSSIERFAENPLPQIQSQ